ncbi:hypothetical protein Pelo_3012 [Pelomyxa schiedti]|nr:hypothetical protein Pelo_3012 [Pelomyxa schiedti]
MWSLNGYYHHIANIPCGIADVSHEYHWGFKFCSNFVLFNATAPWLVRKSYDLKYLHHSMLHGNVWQYYHMWVENSLYKQEIPRKISRSSRCIEPFIIISGNLICVHCGCDCSLVAFPGNVVDESLWCLFGLQWKAKEQEHQDVPWLSLPQRYFPLTFQFLQSLTFTVNMKLWESCVARSGQNPFWLYEEAAKPHPRDITVSLFVRTQSQVATKGVHTHRYKTMEN